MFEFLISEICIFISTKTSNIGVSNGIYKSQFHIDYYLESFITSNPHQIEFKLKRSSYSIWCLSYLVVNPKRKITYSIRVRWFLKFGIGWRISYLLIWDCTIRLINCWKIYLSVEEPKRKESCLKLQWNVWKARNNVVFNGQSFSAQSVGAEVQATLFMWVKFRANCKVLLWSDWCCNPLNLLWCFLFLFASSFLMEAVLINLVGLARWWLCRSSLSRFALLAVKKNIDY